MNLLLLAFTSLQLSLPPKTGDTDITPRPSIIFYHRPVQKRQELWTCSYTADTGQKYCYYNRDMHVSYSLFWREYPVYVNL